MSSGKDSLRTAVLTATEQALRPLVEECEEALGFDEDQLEKLGASLHDAWFFGIRTGHAVMIATKMGEKDPTPVIESMQGEFLALMERLADSLDTTVAATIGAWNFLGRAWIAGAKFWEVEIAARLIEASSGGFEEVLDSLEE